MHREGHLPEVHLPEVHLKDAYWALRLGLGATAFLAGLDKFTNPAHRLGEVPGSSGQEETARQWTPIHARRRSN